MAPNGRAVSSRSLHQRVDVGGTHDGAAAHEGLVVALDAIVVVEIVDHDDEGFLDRTVLGVAEPVDPLEPRAVAEVKTRYRVDAVSGRWLSRQVGRTKPHQGCAQRFALLWIVPPAVAREL